MSRRYLELQELFLNYFHPDWQLESTSRLAAVRKYLRTAQPDAVRVLIEEIHALLAAPLSEEQLHELLLSEYSLNYDPWNDEITTREWLSGLAKDLGAPRAA